MSNKKPRGRPSIDPAARAVEVCLTLPAKYYDAVYTRARAERVSVPELLRRELQKPTMRLKP